MATKIVRWLAKDGSEHSSQREAEFKEMQLDLIESIKSQDYITLEVEEVINVILYNWVDVIRLLNMQTLLERVKK